MKMISFDEDYLNDMKDVNDLIQLDEYRQQMTGLVRTLKEAGESL